MPWEVFAAQLGLFRTGCSLGTVFHSFLRRPRSRVENCQYYCRQDLHQSAAPSLAAMIGLCVGDVFFVTFRGILWPAAPGRPRFESRCRHHWLARHRASPAGDGSNPAQMATILLAGPTSLAVWALLAPRLARRGD